jgi:hypothetical protein
MNVDRVYNYCHHIINVMLSATVAYPQLYKYKAASVPKDGNCLPASALLFLKKVYPNECSFEQERLGQLQTLILESISDNREHWRPVYESTHLGTSSSMTFDDCLAFQSYIHPAYGVLGWVTSCRMFWPIVSDARLSCET